jgi:polysaccharide pyruvyl transferase WcaK-like protein
MIMWNRSYRNMWDELILLWTIRLLQKQWKEVVVSAYDVKWLKSFFSQFTDLKPITYLHEFPKWVRSFFRYFFSPIRRELKIYKSVDSVIIWWWEILTEESPNSYWYWLAWLLPFFPKLDKINVYLMGWIQIPVKKINKWLFDYLLSKVKYIYARDNESVEALREYWFKDVQFFIDTSWFAYSWWWIKKGDEHNKVALINLNKNGEKFFEDLVHQCEALLSNGYTIKYVPVSKWKNKVYNDLYYKEVLEKRLLTKFEVLDWEESFSTFVQEVKNADIVVTARLHLFLVDSFLWVETKVYPYQMKILKMKKIIQDFFEE